jgi:[ribosomal protein S5]-alanine N-acetyltransferase
MSDRLPPTPILETARLRLRPLQLEDAPAVQRLFPRWEIVRWLDAVVPWPYPEDGARIHLRDCMAQRVTEYAFMDLLWPCLWMTNAEANIASRRVKEKQGARPIDRTTRRFISGEGPAEVWLLSRDDWIARQAQRDNTDSGGAVHS